MKITPPYLMFLGDVPDQLTAKTAAGIVDWRPEWCLGQLRLKGCGANLGLPDMGIAKAVEKGAQTFVIGIANAGGVLPDHWIGIIVQAIESGMDIASGLHTRLESKPEIANAAKRRRRSLFDVRHSSQQFTTGSGAKRSGLRLLTVGTDCSVGKKYTVLALEKAMRARGLDADFRATGQTGIFISGQGVAIDAVPADFISGATEWLSPSNADDHWDLIEGQGSLFHPSFAGVSLGLLHGAQPDAFIVCHEPARKTMRGVAHPLRSISEVIDLTIHCGRLTNPAIRAVGIAINTQALDDSAARDYLKRIAAEHDLPATDPVRYGVENIVDGLEQAFPGETKHASPQRSG